MATKYVVNLSDTEREQLLDMTKRGQVSARKIKRAYILLQADDDLSDESIATNLHTGVSTVHRIRQRCVESGLEAALNERPRRGGARKLDGKQEAYLVALACSEPPTGRAVWSMQLLADKLVEAGVVDAVSDETVRRVLKKRT